MTRARELGIPLPGETGPANAITDVPGVEVGYTTLVEGESARTGVTAILPRGRAGFAKPCAAGTYSLNGNGEMTGTAWLAETGSLGLPVLLTNTHAVGPCHRGVIDWVVRERPDVASQWLLPVVAETWDGYLNDVNASTIRPEHAGAALDAARGGPIAEGSVGGGTGMMCYGFKGGTGTASRVVSYGADAYTVGALVQANFGARRELTVAGVGVGAELAGDNPMEDRNWLAPPGSGSVIVVLGTDAPLLPGQCAALARRVPLGLARTGTTGSHFSGDLFLAFSTANPGALTSTFPVSTEAAYESLRFVPWGRIDPFFEAVVHVVEEAVLNALVANEPMVGRNGHRAPALPVDRLAALLQRK
ncbi:P1 family peptidase [Amycolatopsis anabasis]|uniref:DmpA family aminopeptidase n=1 Tax=Amycolatopsis anabasis TaxID=1840409 RepID=UPI00131C5278|nr:P1 family peptidase [Amycolatopsis anabasis]